MHKRAATGVRDRNKKMIHNGDKIRLFDCQNGIRLLGEGKSEPLPKDVDHEVFYSDSDARFLARRIDNKQTFCMGSVGAWTCISKEIIKKEEL